MKDEQQTDKEEQEAEKENEPGAEYKEDLVSLARKEGEYLRLPC